MNSDKAAGAFKFGREQVPENVLENLLRYLKKKKKKTDFI